MGLSVYALLLMFLLLLLGERFGYVSTPNNVSVVCELERVGCMSTPTPVSITPEIDMFGCVITPAPISVILVEGEIWLYNHSYSCIYCLSESEVWLCEHSYSCVYQLDVWLGIMFMGTGTFVYWCWF